MQMTLDFPLTFDPSWGYYHKGWSSYERAIRLKYGIKHSWWSMDPVDFEAEGFTTLEKIWDVDDYNERHEVALSGTRAIDVWMAFDRMMELTNDYHHSFLEQVTEGGRVWAGS